jgi:hypothetical protein
VVGGSEALNPSMKKIEESMRNIPMLDSLVPTPQSVSSGFTLVNDDSDSSGSSDAEREIDIPGQFSDIPDSQKLCPTHRRPSMTTATSFDRVSFYAPTRLHLPLSISRLLAEGRRI